MKVCILGPCSPVDFHLESKLQAIDMSIPFSHGIPLTSLATELIGLGHEVYILTLVPGIESEVEFQIAPNLTLIGLPSRQSQKRRLLTFYWVEVLRIRAGLRAIGPDIVHAHWTYEYARAASRAGIPYVVTAHDAPWTIAKNLKSNYFFVRYLFALRVRCGLVNVLFVSSYLASRWKREMFWRSQPVIIPNCAPIAVQDSSSKNGSSYLTVADASPRKNVKNLLKAWPKVRESISDAQLTLVGDGLGIDSALYRWAATEGLLTGVVWMGRLTREELVHLYRASSVLIHPSLEESFGLTLLEAMAFGMPIVCSKGAGGPAEIISTQGVLIDFSDISEITRTLKRIRFSDEGYLEMSLEARKILKQRYLPIDHAKLYLRVYENTILGHSF